LQTGTYIGRLQFISGNFIQNIFVTAHITPAPAQMTIVSGNNGSGPSGAVLPALRVAVAGADRNPLRGIQVTFSVTSGGASVSTTTAFTDSEGIASTVVTLPSSPGVAQIVASSGPLSVTFTVTAVNAPSLFSNAVLPLDIQSIHVFRPGSIILITGQNFSRWR
jgi:hypothetical protein